MQKGTPRVCVICGKTFKLKCCHNSGNLCSRKCADIYRTRPIAERFWEKVNKTETCWLWTKSLAGGGYGTFLTITDGVKRTQPAHRVAWQLENGPIPDGMFLLHRCDTKRCVRPSHLFLGTQADNIKDMISKDRHASGKKWWLTLLPRGTAHPNAKLTNTQVRTIRKLSARGFAQTSIAARYKVSAPTIARILSRKTWKHVH
jgi:HNH endonuclease